MGVLESLTHLISGEISEIGFEQFAVAQLSGGY